MTREADIEDRRISLMPNSNDVAWKRIFAEGVAIVVSILLAFAIEAWWSIFQDRAEEQGILIGLKSEFEHNLSLIETEIDYRNAVVRSILRIFDASSSQSRIESEIIDELIGDVTWWANIEYSRGAIDGLIQSGRLNLIANERLRNALASIPSVYAYTTRAELNDRDTTNAVVIPFLNSHASLSQIANTMAKGRPGTGQSSTPPVYPASEPWDHTVLLSEPEFLGILVQEHWNHLEAITAYASLKATLENAIGLIDQEISD